MLPETRDFSLQIEWLNFLEDFVANLVNPTLINGGSGKLTTTADLTLVHQYRLEGALLGLLGGHDTSIVFCNGLPQTAHDAGYELWSVEIFDDRIECVVVFQNDQRVTKLSKKTKRFIAFAETSDEFLYLRRFKLPIQVRFEGGKRNGGTTSGRKQRRV